VTVEPNAAERALAARVVMDSWSNPEALAELLAEVREGSTLPGPRAIVMGNVRVSLRHGVAYAEGQFEAATAHAWQAWFRELRRRCLRPCGWPSEQRTYLAFPQIVAGEQTFVELEADDPRAEFLEITVACEAVSMT